MPINAHPDYIKAEKDYYDASSDEEKLAVERFVDSFIQLRADSNFRRDPLRFRSRQYIDRFKGFLRKTKNSYVDQKSEGLDFETVKKTLDEILKLYPDCNQALDCKQIKPFVFTLKSMGHISNE